MKMFLDCLPCVLNQILDASRMSTEDEKIHARIIEEGFALLSKYERYHSSPDLVADLHKVVKLQTGIEDPYAETKRRDIEAALKAYPILLKYLENGMVEGIRELNQPANKSEQAQMYRALKIAVTGNIMDSAIMKDVNLERSLAEELIKPFVLCDLESFERQLASAELVLIIGDNAGEAVFDRVFIEYLDHPNLYYAVREVPIINDVTMEDAIEAGMNKGLKLVSCGSDAPGAVISRCSDDFLELLDRADLVISKGQGNFEALSDYGRDIFFLLKAKCAMIAKRLDVSVNDYVFFRGGNDKPGS